MKFHCPTCNQRIEVDESYAGQSANCPTCSEGLTIPFPAEQTPQPVAPSITQNTTEDVTPKKTTSPPVSSIYLVYENGGHPQIFEVEPRYIKNEKFSAKILEQNRSISFAFSMILGLYEDYSEAEALLVQLKSNEAKYLRIDKLEKEDDKNNAKIDRLEDQHDRLDERVMKKSEVIEDLETRARIEGLTEKQAERLAKANLDSSALDEKMQDLSSKIEALEKLADSNLEELGRLGDENARFLNEQQTKCLFKLHSLGIENRT